MLIADVIRAAIPNADDALVDFVIWSRTPWPMTGANAREIYRAASGWRRAHERGMALCAWCERIVDSGEFSCPQCTALIAGIGGW